MNDMSDVATKKDIEEVLSTLQDFAQHIDERFNLVDQQFDNANERFDTIEKEIIELKESHNRLLNTIDGFVARLDNNETEQAASDYQFQKLLDWARMVSKKTGIPIKDL
jgi:septal ring factor EnvC (AmiA/AmiB activator)